MNNECIKCKAILTSPNGITLDVCPFCKTSNRHRLCIQCEATLTSPNGVTLDICPFCNTNNKTNDESEVISSINEVIPPILNNYVNYDNSLEAYRKLAYQGNEYAFIALEFMRQHKYGIPYKNDSYVVEKCLKKQMREMH